MSLQIQLLNHAALKANELTQLCDLVSKDGLASISNVGVLAPNLSFGALPNHEGMKELLTQFYGTMKAVMLHYPDFDLNPDADNINSYCDYVETLCQEQLEAQPEEDQ